MIDAKLVISITDLIPQSGSLAVVIVSPNFLRHSLSPLSSLFPTLFFSLRLSPIDAARRFFARLIYNVDWPRLHIFLSDPPENHLDPLNAGIEPLLMPPTEVEQFGW